MTLFYWWSCQRFKTRSPFFPVDRAHHHPTDPPPPTNLHTQLQVNPPLTWIRGSSVQVHLGRALL